MKKKYFTKNDLFRAFFVFCFGISLQAQTYTSWKVGSATDVSTTTTQGMCLMGGGTDNDDAIKWMFQKAGGGDVVVLRSAGTDGYNSYMYTELGVPVNSVETIIIDTRAKASIAAIATKIRNAEALFISGGDQATYVSYWKDTPVEDAINYLINTKKVPVGGTSAGCAILGKFYYSAANSSVTSALALANPYNTGVTIGVNDFVNSPILANTITDTHYDNPDRRGRQTTFISRMWKDLGAGLNAKGIGVFEKTAVCIDQNGIARVFAPTTASFAYFYQMESNSTPETVLSGTPLTWNNAGIGVKIVKIPGNTAGSNTFDLNNWITTSGTGISWGNIKVVNGTLTETLGGTPPSATSCATPSGITTSAITNTGATVSWAATTATSYTVRYKTVAATTWTTLSNTTATSVALSGLTLGTAYNVEIVGNCTSGASAAGTTTFTTTGGNVVSYCASKGNSSSSEWISKVVFGTINNFSSANGGYADFSAQSTAVTKGIAKTLTLTPGFSASRKLYWKVYIDYNNNGLFTDAGEEVYSNFSSATLSPSITVPSSAVVGSVRMRVIVSYNSITSPCGTYNYGETEDYTLNIAATAKMAPQSSKILVDTNDEVKTLPAKIGIYPNPAREDFNISFSSDINEKVTVKVFNIQGREEKSFVIDATAGENRIRNNTAGLRNGQYIIKVIKSNEVSTTKLIIAN
ncbi:Secretion system C-terminal sorting domain [Flavobacteriaceae bacterium]